MEYLVNQVKELKNDCLKIPTDTLLMSVGIVKSIMVF
jgi:hypothetical protein